MDHFTQDTLSAIEAKQEAQRIAFAPIMFQAAKALRDLGVLAVVEATGDEGAAQDTVERETGLSTYAARVLLEAGLGIGVLILRDGRYVQTRLGHFLLNDPMTRANMDFVHDVNYRGVYHLQEALRSGKPAGLRELAPDSATVYEALAHLPRAARESWLRFDHFYSDNAFRSALETVFSAPVRTLVDVGANTGKWALACARHDPQVRVTLCDLPGQLAQAREEIRRIGLSERMVEHAIDVLDPASELPAGHDVIWMSQFLDCFSEDQIVAILEKARRAMTTSTRLYILETFWDRQRFRNAAFCLQQTSLYFTCMANGNSQMYHSGVFRACLERAGLVVVEETDGIGISHTLIRAARRD